MSVYLLSPVPVTTPWRPTDYPPQMRRSSTTRSRRWCSKNSWVKRRRKWYWVARAPCCKIIFISTPLNQNFWANLTEVHDLLGERGQFGIRSTASKLIPTGWSWFWERRSSEKPIGCQEVDTEHKAHCADQARKGREATVSSSVCGVQQNYK